MIAVEWADPIDSASPSKLLSCPPGLTELINASGSVRDRSAARRAGMMNGHPIDVATLAEERFVILGRKVVARAIALLDRFPVGSVPRIWTPTGYEQAKARGLKTIDATCPLVTKVHHEAKRFAGDDYDILLIGHAGHEEVEGTSGEAPENIQLVQGPADVPRHRRT